MLQSKRARREHVVHVVFPQQRALHGLPDVVAHQVEARALSPEQLDIFRTHVRGRLASEQD